MTLTTRSVPCNGCTLCCTAPSVRPLDVDEMSKYQHEHGMLRWAGGACVYATKTGCAVHEDKPRRCREFDCRDFATLSWTIARRAGIIRIWRKGRDLKEKGDGQPS